MKKNSAFILRNLSALTFLAIYIVIAIYHLLRDNFIALNQWELLTVMSPFILLGIFLDFIVNRNTVLPDNYKILTRLLPAGIFLMNLITTALAMVDRPSYDIFGYLFWLFLAAPFCIASYRKESQKLRLISTIVGTVLVFAVYLYLTKFTSELNEGNGLIVYILTYFSILYTSSGIRKLPYLGAILGLLNGVVLYLFYSNPMTEAAKTYGWDYYIVQYFETIMLITLTVSILIALFTAIQQGKAAALTSKE